MARQFKLGGYEHYVFYVDIEERPLLDKVSSKLAKLGLDVAKFFSIDVTHLVTNRVTSEDILRMTQAHASEAHASPQSGLGASPMTPSSFHLVVRSIQHHDPRCTRRAEMNVKPCPLNRLGRFALRSSGAKRN